MTTEQKIDLYVQALKQGLIDWFKFLELVRGANHELP